MSRKTPLVTNGTLLDLADSHLIALDTPEWFAWLEKDEHNTFHFTHPSGGFTARKERKQRGQWYWIAYRQMHNKLYKTYLCKSEALTLAHLCSASEKLANTIAED
jgi:LuxR family maltose regulon positive regulatory protein